MCSVKNHVKNRESKGVQTTILFDNSSSLGSISADLTVQLQYWRLSCHPLLSYFPALAEMGNFVFQSQEPSHSTGWGLGEAEENDPCSLSHPAWQCLPLVPPQGTWEGGTPSDTEYPFISFPGWMGLLQLIKCFLMCICIYICTYMNLAFPDGSWVQQGRIWRESSICFLLLVVSKQVQIFSSDILFLSSPSGFVPSHALT